MVNKIIDGLKALLLIVGGLFLRKSGKDAVRLDIAEEKIKENERAEEIERRNATKSNVLILSELRADARDEER